MNRKFWIIAGLTISWMTSAHGLMDTTNELEISWKMLTGYGTYSIYGQAPQVVTNGIMIEVVPGAKISSVPGLDYGFSAMFFALPGQNNFEIISSITGQRERWELTTYVMGSALMIKYGYDIQFGRLVVGLDNGIGLMVGLTQAEYVYYPLSSPTTTGTSRSESRDWGAAADLHLKFHYQFNEFNRLGLNVGGFFSNFEAGQYHMISMLAVGISYQVSF